nr:MAG TPA: hypothetical protein [Caudoviricetes sp.]
MAAASCLSSQNSAKAMNVMARFCSDIGALSGLNDCIKSSLSALLCPPRISSRTAGSVVKSRNDLLRSCKLP